MESGLGERVAISVMEVGILSLLFRQLIQIKHSSSESVESSFLLREDQVIMNDLFLAATEVTEEAILNSLSQAVTTTGRMGNTVHAYPF